MRKMLSLMALLASGVATCVFAALPAITGERENRATGGSHATAGIHREMVYSSDGTDVRSSGDTGRNNALRREGGTDVRSIELRGSAVNLASWEGTAAYGLYNIPYSEDSEFSMVFPADVSIGCGYDNGEGVFYGFSRTIKSGEYVYNINHYDIESGEIIDTVEADYNLQASDIAVDPTTGKAYGCCPGSDGSYIWAELDYATGTRTDLGSIGRMLSGIGADKAGQFYAVGRNGMFYKVDKTDGSLTEIGDTGLTLQYLTGGCYNDRDNTFLMSYSTDSNAGIAEIDITTGQAAVIAEFAPEDDITCLYIPRPAADDKAPAMPELSVTAEGGSMDVRVSLTLPETLFDGTPAHGMTMGYRIYADGELVKEGNATAGGTVVADKTMSHTGNVKFTAVCSNATGDSPKAKVTYFVGFGTPAAPAAVSLNWADNTGTLSWDAVTSSSDGGYLNPADVTYTVYDENDVAVAENLKTTAYSVSLPADNTYRSVAYKVAAVSNGLWSPSVLSNRCGIGSFDAPFNMEFNTQQEFDYNTVYDANENPAESPTWQWDRSYKRAMIRYHAVTDADDWLFSPNIRLEAGYVYVLNAKVYEQSTKYVECLEIYFGKGANVAAMTGELLPPTNIVVNEDSPENLRIIVRPDDSGLYNIGFHAVSARDQDRLYIASYDIEAPLSVTVPDAVTDAEVMADPEGYPRATVSCRLPEKTLGGSDISGKVTLRVLRDGSEIKSVQGDPGAEISFEDNVDASGNYEYTFIPADSDGHKGLEKSVGVFIGAYPPSSATGRIGYNEGNTVTLFWNPVELDIYGNPIPEGSVTYNVFTMVGDEADQKLNDQPVAGNSFEFTIDAPQTQTSRAYAIQPVNRDVPGVTSGVVVAVGPAYPMPINYGEKADGIAGNLTTNGPARFPIGNQSNAVKPFAGNEYFVISFNSRMATASYITGKIHVDGENPVFSFMAYRNGLTDVNEAAVSVLCEGVETQAAVFNNANLSVDAWNKCKVALDEYIGKDIQIRLAGTCLSGVMYSYFDDMGVYSDLNYDVETETISAPGMADNSEPFDITVRVANAAAKATGAFSVVLYRDGEQVDAVDVGNIPRDERQEITFSQTLTPADGEETSFRAEVVFDKDEKPENNASATINVTRRISRLPVVSGVAGSRDLTDDRIGWNAYDPDSYMAEEITEDFESGEPFSHSFAGWSFFDVDGVPVGGFGNFSIPGIAIGETTASFFVFDAGNYPDSFKAHSGNKYLASLYRYDFKEVDDWMISPELPGCEQTVSFWARSYDPSTPEKIEVWYSTTGANPMDFEICGEFGSKVLRSYDWEKFTADLPEGTRYFAIRSCAEDSFMLLIDDVTCTRVPVETGDLLGYNVYCNGSRINSDLVTGTSFANTHDCRDLTYRVSAVFASGESELSDGFTLRGTDVKGIMADGLGIKAAAGHIRVTGTEGRTVTVTTVDGILIHRGAGDVDLTVLPAVYIVDVNGKAVKVVVR